MTERWGVGLPPFSSLLCDRYSVTVIRGKESGLVGEKLFNRVGWMRCKGQVGVGGDEVTVACTSLNPLSQSPASEDRWMIGWVERRSARDSLVDR
jgi:hypothetical protein